jgi:hypothetical protein
VLANDHLDRHRIPAHSVEKSMIVSRLAGLSAAPANNAQPCSSNGTPLAGIRN